MYERHKGKEVEFQQDFSTSKCIFIRTMYTLVRLIVNVLSYLFTYTAIVYIMLAILFNEEDLGIDGRTTSRWIFGK
jgi:hypothetical protein